MSCQCGCGRTLHLLDLSAPAFELHVESGEGEALLWWVMRKGEPFGTPKCKTAKEAIEFIPVLAPIWRQPWRSPRGWIG